MLILLEYAQGIIGKEHTYTREAAWELPKRVVLHSPKRYNSVNRLISRAKACDYQIIMDCLKQKAVRHAISASFYSYFH